LDNQFSQAIGWFIKTGGSSLANHIFEKNSNALIYHEQMWKIGEKN
jgi:hypothetical protein